MNKGRMQAYFDFYSRCYFSKNIFNCYPETRIIPRYFKEHFSDAQVVLDLGFGTGLWFWASFLPSLCRLDGIDQFPQALDHANQVFNKQRVPGGWRKAHQSIGETITIHEVRDLQQCQGKFFFSDYLENWPDGIQPGAYDLVTEHGGGLTRAMSAYQFTRVIQNISQALKPGGSFFFMNLEMEPDHVEKKVIRKPSRDHFVLTREVAAEACGQSNLALIDYLNAENILYGIMRKSPAL